ncbi:MAG: DUF6788 family protein [Endomicrobiales bacterium]|jgi:hypothetical protein
MKKTSALYRQKLKKLFKDGEGLLRVFMLDKPLLKGMIYKQRIKCGNAGCKCNKLGELHEVYRFTRSFNGVTQNRSINFAEVLKYEPGTKSYLKYRTARADLAKLHKEQIKVIDLLEKSMTSDEFDKDIQKRDREAGRRTYWKPRTKD